MFGKCPGQDTRYWTHQDIYEDNCPDCGEAMEFWKTDLRVKCRNCGRKVVNRSFNLGCATWCSYAEQCLGGAARQLRPDSIREKIEERAGEILSHELMAELKAEAESAVNAVKKEKVNMPVVLGLIFFKSIIRDKGIDEAVSILNDMADAGDIPPQAANGIKEEMINYTFV